MIALRLVRLIEAHSEELSRGLLDKILTSDRTSDFHRVDREELQRGAYDIYEHLSDWLLTKTESDIEVRYTQVGERRARQGVSLSHLLWGVVLTKDHLWAFLQREAIAERAIDLFGELELLRLLEQFFDRAMYYVSVGFARSGTHAKAA